MSAPQPTAAAVQALRRAGLTARDIATLYRVRSHVIEAMLAAPHQACRSQPGSDMADVRRLLRLLAIRAECAALRLERRAGEGGAA